MGLPPATPLVLVFSQNGGGAWTQQGRIPATLSIYSPPISGGPEYGAMALSSDGSTLAVGAELKAQGPEPSKHLLVMHAFVAAMQGRTAVYHAMGDAVTPIQLRNVTSNIFTAPEIATVGFSQKQIEDGETRGITFKLMLETNPRAKMQGIDDGFIKLFARTGSGTVIGGVVVAPKASELIYSIAIAVENRLTVDELARTFAVYPSLSGSISDAARALHLPSL